MVLFCAPVMAAPGAALIPLDVPAQRLSDAVVEFARQAEVSVGYSGFSLGHRKSHAVVGFYTLDTAVRRLLEGTGFTFRIVDSKTVLILPASPATRPPRRKPVPVTPPDSRAIEEVVVTSTKRAATVQSLPYSIAAVTGGELRQWNIEDDNQLALQVAGVTTTNRGAGRNKIILRGLSDGSFTGRTQSAVGLYFDDARITFNAPDPGLKLLDIDRIEVLRGPQGTLYGAGALGGLFRVITNKPVLDDYEASAGISAATTRNGAPSHDFQAMVNVPLIDNVLAVRAVGYRDRDGGYIDDISLGLKNVNRTTTSGARLSARWQISDQWQATTGLTVQSVKADDTQYSDGGLGRLQRGNLLREPHKNDFLQSYLTVDGSFAWGRLVSSTSYLHHDIDNSFDASHAVPAIAGLPATPSPFSESRDIQNIIHETRVTSNDDGRLRWLAGVFFSHRDEVLNTALEVPGSGQALKLGPSDILFSERRVDDINELALFGEATLALANSLSVTGGLRWFRSRLAATSLISEPLSGPPGAATGHSATSGVTPKLVVGFQPDPDRLLYIQVAEGNRVGGVNLRGPVFESDNPDVEPGAKTKAETLSSFPSDHLWNFEIGAKGSFFDRRLVVNMAAFFVIWNQIQSDQVGPRGFPFVANIGDARIRGIEAELTARPVPRFVVRAHITLNDASLRETMISGGNRIDSQLPDIPVVSAGVAARYERPLGGNIRGSIGGDYAYVGKSSLGFDAERSPRMGGYHLGNLRLGVSWPHWRATLFIDNLWDQGANTFAFGNPFSLGAVAQVTPLRPRTAGLRLNWVY